MFVTILSILSNAKTRAEAQIALSQLESIKLRHKLSDAKIKTEVWDKIDPQQKRLIDNGFIDLIPQLNDWITCDVGIGYITQVEGDNCQVLFVESNDAEVYNCKFMGEESTTKYFRTGLDWLPLKEVKLISVPQKYRQVVQSQKDYNNLSDQDKMIQDFIEIGTYIESRENLKEFYLDLANAYKSGDISADAGKRIMAGLPRDKQSQIEEIKKELSRK